MEPYRTLSLIFGLAVTTQAIPARAANQPRAGKTQGAIVVGTNIARF